VTPKQQEMLNQKELNDYNLYNKILLLSQKETNLTKLTNNVAISIRKTILYKCHHLHDQILMKIDKRFCQAAKRKIVFLTALVSVYPIEKYIAFIMSKQRNQFSLQKKQVNLLNDGKQVIYNNKYDQLFANVAFIESQQGKTIDASHIHSPRIRRKSPKAFANSMDYGAF
jgi:hypothetical protein